MAKIYISKRRVYPGSLGNKKSPPFSMGDVLLNGGLVRYSVVRTTLREARGASWQNLLFFRCFGVVVGV